MENASYAWRSISERPSLFGGPFNLFTSVRPHMQGWGRKSVEKGKNKRMETFLREQQNGISGCSRSLQFLRTEAARQLQPQNVFWQVLDRFCDFRGCRNIYHEESR
jgi:hypothetical protein